MPSMRSLPYARAAFLAGCLTLGSLYACSDRQPTLATRDAGARLQASGEWASTMWSIGPAGLTYAGGVTGRATPDAGVRRAPGGVRAFLPSAADLETRRVELQGSLPRVPELPKAAGRTGTPTLRMSLRGARTSTTRTSDGRLVQTQVLGARGASPPAAMLVSVDGRPRTLIQNRYARDREQWRLLSPARRCWAPTADRIGWSRTISAACRTAARGR